jgi:hypothetical protein
MYRSSSSYSRTDSTNPDVYDGQHQSALQALEDVLGQSLEHQGAGYYSLVEETPGLEVRSVLHCQKGTYRRSWL